MREKVRRLEKDIDQFRDETKEYTKEYVTQNHFKAVLDPLQRTLEMVQKDVKEILRAVASTNKTKN